MRPFFSYYGSKWSVAPRYPAPEFDSIVEPFAGSAGYSLRYADRQVVLVDRDPVIVAIWRWLITASADQVMALPTLDKGERLDQFGLSEPERWLMGFWISQGVATPRMTATQRGAWTAPQCRSGRNACDLFKERCAAQVGQIRHWQVIDGDYAVAPDIAATWFIDPPYGERGSHYRYGPRDLDYDALAGWCRQRRGQVIVCENEGATWLPFEPIALQAGSVNYGGSRRRITVESVWTNQ